MGNISSIIQVIALAGFLIGFGGIAMIVASASQGRPVRSGVGIAAAGLIAGVLLLLVSQGLLVVGPTERAVVFNTLSGNLENPRGSGIHIIIPGVQNVTMYPVSQQNYTMADSADEGGFAGGDAIRARSVDGQEVRVDLTLIFRLVDTAEQLNQLHRDWSVDPGGYREGLIRPTVRSVVRDVAARFEAEAIYGVGREDMQAEIRDRLVTQLEPQGVQISDVLVRDVNFSDEFINAIEAKQVEEQQLQRAITEAQRRRTEAQGLADADVERARGQAQSITIRALAEAEALRLISDQIAANPNLIQYTYIQNLSDNVSLALVPSGSPFLFDFNTFTDLGADFEAPPVPEPNLPDIIEPETETGNSN